MQEYLRDRSKVREMVQLFDPIVRAVDGIAGERVSMRVRFTEQLLSMRYNLTACHPFAMVRGFCEM